jgi:hypothetical protein
MHVVGSVQHQEQVLLFVVMLTDKGNHQDKPHP